MDKKTRRRNRKQRQHRRRTRRDTTGFEMAVPIWQYPQAARQAAAATHDSGDPIGYEQMLALIAAHPIRVSEPGRKPAAITPSEVAATSGVPLDGFLAHMARLHEDGVITWDAGQRVHRVDAAAAELFGLLPA